MSAKKTYFPIAGKDWLITNVPKPFALLLRFPRDRQVSCSSVSCRAYILRPQRTIEKITQPRLIKAGRTRTIHEPTRRHETDTKKASLVVRVVSCDLVDRPTGSLGRLASGVT